jgi:two-component system, OmpR family, response regulator MprA
LSKVFINVKENVTMSHRILVVDDDEASREFMTTALEDEGYEVLGAENGVVALKIIAAFQPHLVLLDMRMPQLDGEAFLARYEGIYGQQVPVIGLSASLAYSTRLSGINAFLPKPFDLEELLCSVATNLRASPD